MEYEIGSNERVSMAVVRAVSAINGRDPCSIRPLAEIVDPDAVDAVFDGLVDGTPRVGGRLTFVYENCRVTVDAGEYLRLEQIEPDLPNSGPRSNVEDVTSRDRSP